jgi:hypothetical protein
MAPSPLMIVIIAEPNDVHAQVVARRIQGRGQACTILNAADFPQRCDLTTEYCAGKYRHSLVGPFGEMHSDEVTGLWVRRMSAHDISPDIADRTIAKFAYEQCKDHFLAFTSLVPNVINPRVSEMHSELKPLQLRAAQEVGLRIPKTIISNRAEHIREFISAAKTEVVFKTLSSSSFQFTGTSLFKEESAAFFDTIKFASTIFQEKIDAKLHIRSTIIDQTILSASISSEKDYAALDWRLDRDPEIRPHRLPQVIEDRLRALCRELGLRYGAADLILSTADEYVFLEINPGGQFLFVEIHGELPISQAIADALIGQPRPRPC